MRKKSKFIKLHIFAIKKNRYERGRSHHKGVEGLGDSKPMGVGRGYSRI